MFYGELCNRQQLSCSNSQYICTLSLDKNCWFLPSDGLVRRDRRLDRMNGDTKPLLLCPAVPGSAGRHYQCDDHCNCPARSVISPVNSPQLQCSATTATTPNTKHKHFTLRASGLRSQVSNLRSRLSGLRSQVLVLRS